MQNTKQNVGNENMKKQRRENRVHSVYSGVFPINTNIIITFKFSTIIGH